MNKKQLVLQFLENQKEYSVQELQQQLSRYSKKQVPTSDLKEVLDVLAGDRNDRGYLFRIYDLAGSFERQAYLLDKELKQGQWTFDHIVVFSILVHCARIEPRLITEENSIFCSLLEYLTGR